MRRQRGELTLRWTASRKGRSQSPTPVTQPSTSAGAGDGHAHRWGMGCDTEPGAQGNSRLSVKGDLAGGPSPGTNGGRMRGASIAGGKRNCGDESGPRPEHSSMNWKHASLAGVEAEKDGRTWQWASGTGRESSILAEPTEPGQLKSYQPLCQQQSARTATLSINCSSPPKPPAATYRRYRREIFPLEGPSRRTAGGEHRQEPAPSRLNARTWATARDPWPREASRGAIAQAAAARLAAITATQRRSASRPRRRM